MNAGRVTALVTLLLGAAPLAAQDFRCDCTSVVDTCRADVAVSGNSVDITTSAEQCARVDYFIDGLPFVAVVIGGEERREWLARTSEPRIMVQSCQVCRDSGPDAAPSAALVPRPADANDSVGQPAKLEPLIASVPTYPENARGARGHVDLEVTVNATGQVESARVVAAQPAGVFDQAALAAINRWRYPAENDRAPLTLTERIEFRPPERAGATLVATDEPAAPTGAPRNQCVRESAVYNYGEMVDVGLMNACHEPLVVYGCARGTGRYLDRWLCITSEDQTSVLVPPSDPRIGSQVLLPVTDGTRTFTYSDSMTVTRAPNSQYWWVACAVGDVVCQDGARQWSRAVAGQPAAIDPQARSPVAVARSN